MRALLLAGLVLALVGVVACGNRPTTLRARMTYEFETPAGPRSGSTILELQRSPATPYLPGGERGTYKRIGDAAVVELPAFSVFMDRNFEWTLATALREGRATPVVDMSGVRPGVDKDAPEFFRRVTKAGLRAVLPVASLESHEKDDIRLYQFANPADPGSLQSQSLPEFEAAHPDLRLVRIAVAITDEPIPRGLDAKLPWLRSYQTSVARTIREGSLSALRENY
jgi:hypothetical protein